MEMFQCSKRELEERFTRSELFLVAWRSQEVSYNMEQASGSVGEGKARAGRDSKFQGLPEKFFDPETGEIDLRRVSGEEARKFLMRQGMKLPVIRPSKKHAERLAREAAERKRIAEARGDLPKR